MYTCIYMGTCMNMYTSVQEPHTKINTNVCPSLLSVAMLSTMSKRNLGMKGSIPPYSYLREVRTGAPGRSWSREHERVLLTGWLPVPCLACLPMPLSTTFPGVALPNVDWAFPRQPQSQFHQSDEGILSVKVYFPQMISACAKKPNRTTGHLSS